MRTRRGAAALVASLAAVAVVLAGCGEETPERADPAPGSTGSPAPASGPAEVVEILSGSNAGGAVDLEVTPLDDAAAVDAFVAPFADNPLAGDVRTAVRRAARDGGPVGAAVIAIGCDVPPTATVTDEPDGSYLVVPGKVVAPKNECLVPVTTVAIVDLPAADG
jgi:hypothetical protein